MPSCSVSFLKVSGAAVWETSWTVCEEATWDQENFASSVLRFLEAG
jgi:hypothetical protein